MRRKLLFCFLILVFSACSSGPKTPPSTSQALPTETPKDSTEMMPAESFKNLATQKYGQNVKYIYNESKTCVMCLQMTNNSDPNRSYFFLYDIKSSQIILEEQLENANARWIDNDQLKVSITPGIVKGKEGEENSELGYIFNIKSKKRTQTKNNLPEVN